PTPLPSARPWTPGSHALSHRLHLRSFGLARSPSCVVRAQAGARAPPRTSGLRGGALAAPLSHLEPSLLPPLRSRRMMSAMPDVSARLERLIAMDTQNPGGNERALCEALAHELDAVHPDRVAVLEAQGHASVLACFGTPRLLVNAHIDTVPA